jgi:hypothetical protein
VAGAFLNCYVDVESPCKDHLFNEARCHAPSFSRNFRSCRFLRVSREATHQHPMVSIVNGMVTTTYIHMLLASLSSADAPKAKKFVPKSEATKVAGKYIKDARETNWTYLESSTDSIVRFSNVVLIPVATRWFCAASCWFVAAITWFLMLKPSASYSTLALYSARRLDLTYQILDTVDTLLQHACRCHMGFHAHS